MRTKKKSQAMKVLEGIIGGPLTLGALLSAIREGEEETQTEFAAKLGVSIATVSNVRNGRTDYGR